MSNNSASRYVRTPEAAAHIGLATVTLEKDRVSGRMGLPFIKIGRVVLYDLNEIDGWLAKHRRSSTADPGTNLPIPANDAGTTA
jgi:predicted DNA-binding transcriptional regulator AlpA